MQTHANFKCKQNKNYLSTLPQIRYSVQKFDDAVNLIMWYDRVQQVELNTITIVQGKTEGFAVR